jgi:hypothetical protein
MFYYGANTIAPASAFEARFADHDGTNDWTARGADLSGSADGNDWAFSVWFKAATLGANRTIFTNSLTSFAFTWDNTDLRMELIIEDTAGTQRVRMYCLDSMATGVPHHFCAFGDGTLRNAYIDDVAATVNLYGSNTLDFTTPNWSIGAQPTGAVKWVGGIGELWFGVGSAFALDFDTTSNRRKFITAGGLPVDLGENGEIPTGSSPLSYHSFRTGGSPNDFATERGTSGTWTLNGALADGGAISL